MTYAIFSGKGKHRVLHAVQEGAHKTVCERPIGVGTGMVRDGNYSGSTPCKRCWGKS